MFRLVLAAAAVAGSPSAIQADEIREIGSRRELFVDHYLIEKMNNTRLKLHHPRQEEMSLLFNKPWEGEYTDYPTVVKDGDTYRMWYRAHSVADGVRGTCYAESKDGIHWTRPNLRMFEVAGTLNNNVCMPPPPAEATCMAFFIDTKSGVPAAERYKGIGRIQGGLIPYCSADGVHWRRMADKPVITKGAFDSHNLAFYSESEHCYVCYFRWFKRGVRDIRRCVSEDFLHWSEPVDMSYGDTPREHLYTSEVAPYFRAPHIYIALPSRFMAGKDVVSQARKKELGTPPGYFPKGSGFNDMPLMTSRGGSTFQRTFMESFILPGIGPKNWTSRANYPGIGIVPTPDSETEMSLYVQRHTGYTSNHLMRYTLRYDGFISVFAPFEGGELVTKPLVFQGTRLLINYRTSAPGSIRCEILEPDGKPIPAFAMAECDPIIGDEIERVVSWKGRTDVDSLAGKPVRLRFEMKAADLYSLKFRP